MKNIILFLLLGTFVIQSCAETDLNNTNNDLSDINGNGDDNNSDNNNDNPSSDGVTWLINKSLVFDGGPGKDGIPALINPDLIDATAAVYLDDDDLVIGLKFGDDIIAFPHKILDWHEIINVDVNNRSIAITYCPLTGTAVGWNRVINNSKTTFGVSGLLYKNNLLPYDRATDSYWSQLKLECVNGELIGEIPKTTSFPEMKWETWKKLYPKTKVVSTNTGHSRNYEKYPYGSYKTNNTYFIFPTDALHSNIAAKDRVHAIIMDGTAKVFQFRDFRNGSVIRDQFLNRDILVVGNPEFIVSFELDESTQNLNFTYNYTDSEIVLSDDEGNNWNIFGEALSGPKKGTFLKLTETSMMAYYFSIDNFYPDIRIYN